MNRDEEVVNAIFNELFNDNSLRYKQSLSKPVNNDIDVCGKARNALAKLSQEERDNVLTFIDVVIADSASVIFGTLDGTHYPDDLDGDFAVIYKNEEVQGNLQDILVEKAEGKGIYS